LRWHAPLCDVVGVVSQSVKKGLFLATLWNAGESRPIGASTAKELAFPSPATATRVLGLATAIYLVYAMSALRPPTRATTGKFNPPRRRQGSSDSSSSAGKVSRTPIPQRSRSRGAMTSDVKGKAKLKTSLSGGLSPAPKKRLPLQRAPPSPQKDVPASVDASAGSAQEGPAAHSATDEASPINGSAGVLRKCCIVCYAPGTRSVAGRPPPLSYLKATRVAPANLEISAARLCPPALTSNRRCIHRDAHGFAARVAERESAGSAP